MQPGRNPGLTLAASGAVWPASIGHVTVTSGGGSTRGGGRRQTGLQGRPAAVPEALTVAEQLTFHRGEIQRLEQQQRAELETATTATVARGVVFNAKDLWQHQAVSPELAAAFAAAGIHNARQLGKWLRNSPHAFERVGVEHNAALWMLRI